MAQEQEQSLAFKRAKLEKLKKLQRLKHLKFLKDRKDRTGFADVDVPTPPSTGTEIKQDFENVTSKKSIAERIADRAIKGSEKAFEHPDTGFDTLDTILGLSIAPHGAIAGIVGGTYDELIAPIIGVEPSGKRLERDLMAMSTELIGATGGVLGGTKATFGNLSKAGRKRLKAFNEIERTTHETIDKAQNLNASQKAALKQRYSNALQRRIKQTSGDYDTLLKRYRGTKKLQGKDPLNRVNFLVRSLESAGVPINPARAEVQFIEAIMTHRLPTEKLVPLVNTPGLSLNDIDDIFRRAIRAKPPVWVAAKNEFNLWNATIPRAQAIVRASRVDRAADFAQLSVEANLKQAVSKHALARGWHTFDSFRRTAMVSQMATAVRNATVGGGRAAVDTLSEMFEAGYTTVLNPLQAPKAWSQVGSTMRWLVQGQTPAARRAIDQILSSHPVQHDRMFQMIMPELDTATGRLSRGAGSVARSIMLAFNIAQERIFRRGAFMNEASKILREKGISPNAVIRDPKAFQRSLSEKDIFRAVENAMDFTFANEPQNEALRDAIRAFNKTPGTLAVPFARFLTQALKFIGEHSTSPVWNIIRGGIKGDFSELPKNLSKVTTGAALYLASEEMVNGDLTPFGLKHGDEWNIFIDSKGNRIDIRNHAPLSFFVWLADFRKRSREGTLPEGGELASYVADGTIGMQARLEGGFRALEGVRESVLDMAGLSSTKGTGDSTSRTAGRFTGGIVSQFLTPLRTLDDLWGYYDSSEGIERNRRVDPFFSTALSNIPGDKEIIERLTNNKLEPLVDPFSPESPVMRRAIVWGQPGIQITGIKQGRKLGATLRRMNSLGIPGWTKNPYTGFPEYDHVIAKNMQQLMPVLDKLIEDKLPEKMDKDMQMVFINEQLSVVTKLARDAAKGDGEAVQKMQQLGHTPHSAPALDLLYKMHGISKPKLKVIAMKMPQLLRLPAPPKGIPEAPFKAMQQAYILAKQQGIELKSLRDYRDFLRSIDRVSRGRTLGNGR